MTHEQWMKQFSEEYQAAISFYGRRFNYLFCSEYHYRSIVLYEQMDSEKPAAHWVVMYILAMSK